MPMERLLGPRVGIGHKIEQLSAVEYRVWTIYLLSADDYGVMPALAAKIQGTDRWCSKQAASTITKALERAIEIKLLRAFDVDGDRFVCSLNWQKHQHIRRPRKTILPIPPADILAECEPETRALFTSRNDSGEPPQSSGSPAETLLPSDGNISARVDGCVKQQPQQTATATALAIAGEGTGEGPVPRALGSAKHRANLAYSGQIVDVPHFLHEEFRRKLLNAGRAAAVVEAELQAWYRQVEGQFTGQRVGDPAPTFWRARFAEWVGLTPKRKPTVAELNRGTFNRLHPDR